MIPLPAKLETLLLALLNPDCAWHRWREGTNLHLLARMKAWKRAGYFAGVTHLLDAGANEGSFARAWQTLCPDTSSLCFEPVPETHARMVARCRSVPAISPVRIALGAEPGRLQMNVGAFHEANSLLPMNPAHIEHWPSSAPSSVIDVEVWKLDDYLKAQGVSGTYFLKADVQGFELQLFRGATETLKRTPLLQVEISLVPLYREAPDLADLWRYLEPLGYRLLDVADLLLSPQTGKPVSCDLLFERR